MKNTVRQTVDQILTEQKIQISKDDELLANLDSLQLVQLVLELETRFELKESLANENSFSKSKSPFRTVQTLVEYLEENLA